MKNLFRFIIVIIVMLGSINLVSLLAHIMTVSKLAFGIGIVIAITIIFKMANESEGE